MLREVAQEGYNLTYLKMLEYAAEEWLLLSRYRAAFAS